MIVEIFINGELIDLPENVEELHFPLTYSIGDLKRPEKRKRNFSKSITLPGTQRNNQFFEAAYDLGRIDTDGSGFGFDFDPTLRYPCRIIRNGQLIFSGAVNLDNVERKNGVNHFNVTLYSAMTDIFQQLGDITISELGWSEYDHVLSVANIQASWSAPIGSGYVYPLIDYGFTDDTQNYKTNELRPFVYWKEIIEKCFEKAGFTLSSVFINSAFFRDYILGYGGGDPIDLDSAEIASRRVNYTGDGTKDSGTLLSNQFKGPENWGYAYNIPVPIGDNDDLTLTLVTDPKGQFNTPAGEVVIANNGYFNLNITADIDLNYTVLPLPFTTYSLLFTVRIQIFKNYALIADQKIEHFDTTNGSTTLNFNIAQDIDAEAGDVITARIFSGTAHSFSTKPGAIQYDLDLNNTLNYDLTALNVGLVDGDTVELARHLPKMKAKDFLNDVIVSHNMYVSEPDADENILMEPFDQFFGETDEAIDWSEKVDHAENWKISPASTIKDKTYQFRFAEDRDYYKERYFKQYGIDYGDFNYDVPSTFKTGEKKYELKIAQSIPVQLEGTDIIIPRIIKYDEGTGISSPHKGKPRAFKYLGTVASDPWTLENSSTGALTEFNTYPLAHHLDDLDDPTFDFNFGRPEVVYYAATSYTTANLFYEYHARLIRELTGRDSKILNVMVDMKETDLYKGFMRDLVNIDGVIYRKNIVKDFLVTVRKKTKVELIRIVESFSKKDYQDALPEIPALPIDGIESTDGGASGVKTAKNNKGMYEADSGTQDIEFSFDPGFLQTGKETTIVKTAEQNTVTLTSTNPFPSFNDMDEIKLFNRFDWVTVKFDGRAWVIVASGGLNTQIGEDIHSGVAQIDADEVIKIESRKQMTVYDGITIDGELQIDGGLILT